MRALPARHVTPALLLALAATALPAGPSAATSVDPAAPPPAATRTYSFEDGRPAGWRAIGTSTLTVTDRAARTGTRALELTGLGEGGTSGLRWSRKLLAFPGAGGWYRVQVPVRAEASAGLVWMRLQGVSDVATTAVPVSPGAWSVLDAWFQPADGADTVTMTLEQAPDVGVAGTTLAPAALAPIGTVWVDDVTIGREAALPEAAAAP